MAFLEGRRLNPFKLARLLAVVAGVIVAVFVMTSGKSGSTDNTADAAPKPDLANIANIANITNTTIDTGSGDTSDIETILSLDTPINRYDRRLDSMPGNCVKMHINYLGGNLGRVFNDSNYIHLEAARRIGIDRITSVDDILSAKRPLVKIESNANIFVDQLTHSHPFLVPEAATLLNDIGHAFRDSLASRGGGNYRVKVTSVLRTESSVAKLRRRNVNAIEESTHLFATTFDISYSNFACDNDQVARSQEDLKNLLGEVLNDMRNRGRCYVKYERKQSCFHITATGLQPK